MTPTEANEYLTRAKSRLHNFVMPTAMDGVGNVERAIEVCKIEALISIAESLKSLDEQGIAVIKT